MSSPAPSEDQRPSPPDFQQGTVSPSYHCSLVVAGRELAFLDLDFQTTARPELITRLLALVETGTGIDSTSAEDSPLWQLSVATRLKRLLHILRDSEDIASLPLRLSCPQEDCRQFLEVDLSLADLDALHDEAADRELLRFADPNSRPLSFRRPTGDDLRRWRNTADSGAFSQETVFRSLLVAENTPAEPIQLPSAENYATAFAEFDALVAFQLTTTCPHCGRESSHALDLETIALNRLGALQQQLFQENHQLARAYGWSETDILSVPRTRRRKYLARLEESA